MGQITDTELIAAQLFANSTISNEVIIKDLIDSDSASDFKQQMYEGIQYYKSKNTNIKNREFEYYSDGTMKEDIYRANNKIANGYLKRLVGQKVNYCLAKEMILDGADNIKTLIDINEFTRKMSKEA